MRTFTFDEAVEAQEALEHAGHIVDRRWEKGRWILCDFGTSSDRENRLFIIRSMTGMPQL